MVKRKLIFLVARPFGFIFLVIGIAILSLNALLIYRSVEEKAIITEILERRSGIQYNNVPIGSVYPCKLKVKIEGKNSDALLLDESEPCSPFLFPYYKVGEIINVYYTGDSVEVVNLVKLLLIPFVVTIIGIGLLFSPKILGKII